VEQIRQAFDAADRDSDGQLSRAEAQRLAILPRSFEDLDQNKDGVLSRSEYQAGFAP
jgi:Ca2+-binding EF-hand superfamily protein